MRNKKSKLRDLIWGFLLIALGIINPAGTRLLYSQTPDSKNDKLISVTKFYGGERREYEDRIEVEYSKDVPGYYPDVAYDSLMGKGPFPGLAQIEFTGGSIYYNADLAIPICTLNRTFNTRDPHAANAKVISEGPVLIRSPLSPGSDDVFEFSYNWGPSGGPGFNIKKITGRQYRTVAFYGDKLYVPCNGYIYVEGHALNAFNHRKKYRYENGRFPEMPQAAYYVGLKTYVSAPMDLYSDTTFTEIVATLSENQPVEVLIADFNEMGNDDHNVLLRTSFGITGWVRFTDPYPPTHIEGMYLKFNEISPENFD